MLLRVLLSALILTSSVYGEAALLCRVSQRPMVAGTPQFAAATIDSLNRSHNRMPFDKELLELSAGDYSHLPFLPRMKAHYFTRKLNKHLTTLSDSADWDRYDFTVFTAKLEQLVSLADPTVLKTMSKSDQRTYRQVQHSILVHGIDKFFFAYPPKNQSLRSRMFGWLMTPLKNKYSRWYFMAIRMPHLRGAIIPPELAMKVAWDGIEAHRQELAPYMLHTNFKHFFNVWSTFYNWTLVVTIFGVMPTYTYFTFKGDLEAAVQQARVTAQSIVDQTAKLAKLNFDKHFQDADIENYREEYRARHNGQEPSDEEIQLIRTLLESQKSVPASKAQSQSQASTSEMNASEMEWRQVQTAPAAPSAQEILPAQETVTLQWVQVQSQAQQQVVTPQIQAPQPSQVTWKMLPASESPSEEAAPQPTTSNQSEQFQNYTWVQATSESGSPSQKPGGSN